MGFLDRWRKPQAAPAPQLRDDSGWQNIFTGLGVVGKDKRLGSSFCASPITQEEADQVWRGDDIAARIVEIIPDEMLRQGFETCVQKGKDGQEAKDVGEAIDAEHRRLNTVEHVRRALYFSRAFGGGGILLGVDDGMSLDKPLIPERVKSFKFMNVFSPRELIAQTYYSDPLQARFGEVATYRLMPINVPPGSVITGFPLVHESRIIRFDGNFTTRATSLRNTQPGWDDSIFVRVLQVINDFQMGYQGSALLMTDFSTPVLKIKGLAKLLAAADSKAMAERARALEITRSIARVSIMDADEEYKRESTPVTGLPDLLEKVALRLAAATGIPVSLLMGQSPAGLNATGDADVRWFYDNVAAFRERKARPGFKQITQMIMLAKDGPTGGKEPDNWDLSFKPLWQLTEKETAELRFTQAQTDQIYIVNQVVTPQEIAKSRFGGDGYSIETKIDLDLREQMDNPDDAMVQLGAGAAEDKQLAQDNQAKAAEKPAPAPQPAG